MERLIIGTGRCGSTLLSEMLACSPEMVSIFEFFNGLPGGRRFTSEPMPASDLWELLTTPHPILTAVLRRGYEVHEVVYPFGRPGTRFAKGDPLPWILVAALPRISDDPDRLFEEARQFVLGLPTQLPVQHYESLFSWLTQKGAGTIWNERSGSGIDSTAELVAAFPSGRFLHIHRDGMEAALSMREHAAFRLAVTLVYDLDPDLDLAAIMREDASGKDMGGALSRALEGRPDAEHFGRFWSDQLAAGYRAVRDLRPDQYLEVSFEELVGSPAETLGRISAFFEMDGQVGDWRRVAADLVRGLPAQRASELPIAERTALAAACRTGNLLLGREPSVRGTSHAR